MSTFALKKTKIQFNFWSKIYIFFSPNPKMSFLNDLSPKFVKFCMSLSICSYHGDFEENQRNLIYKNIESRISQPVFFVLKIGNDIFVVTRGAASANDFKTILDMSEIQTEYGTFHSGFFKAAHFVYEKVKSVLENLKDTYENLYFVGHSYGGAVSASLILLFKDFKNRAVIFGAPPVVDLEHSIAYNKCIASFVAEHDLIPTLSVPNIAKQLEVRKVLMSVDSNGKANFSAKELIHEFNKILDSFDTEGVPAGNEVVASLKAAAPLFIDNVLQLVRDNLDKVVRYVPGCVFRITKESAMKLIECKVNPKDELAILSSFKSAVADHPPGSYETCLNALIE